MGERLFTGNADYKIKIDHHDFPASLEKKFFYSAGKMRTELSFSASDLFHDIVTCGTPVFNLSRQDEIKYKIYLVRTALEVDDEGFLIVSDRLIHLDSSERNFISYYIGMFMTKLVSRAIFGYDYLVHLGIVSKYKKVIRGEKEPDLVGFTKKGGAYSLFEAKGRKIVRSKMVADARQQIQSIKGIQGMKPTFGVVCVTHPIEERKRVICSMYDPELEEFSQMEVNREELLYLYYLPVYELIWETGNRSGQCSFSFDERVSDSMKCHIEMPASLFAFFLDHPNFSEYTQGNCDFKLMEITSGLSANEKSDLLTIELCES